MRQRTAGEEARLRRRELSREERHGHSPKDSARSRRDRRPSPQPATEPPAEPKPPRDEEPPLFVLDTRGDPHIRQYKANDPRKVPRYRRFTNKKVLGSDEPITIALDGSKEVFSTKEYRESGSIFHHKHFAALKAALSQSAQVDVLQDIEQTGRPAELDEFMPLSPSAELPDTHDDSSDESGEEGLSFRSILGNIKSRQKVPQSTTGNERDHSPVLASGPSPKEKARRSELSVWLRQHPHDINAWIEYADLAHASLPSEVSDGLSPELLTKAVAEVKLVLLQKALAKAESKEDRARLSLRIIREAGKLETPGQLAARWEEVGHEHDDDFELWRARLGFEMTNMATFSFKRIHRFFAVRLQALREKLSGSGPGQYCQELVYVFLLATRFLEDAGFPELATAAWQAQLELTFARPKDLGKAPLMEGLGSFWESEKPRIGEMGAKGWSASMDNVDSFDPPPAQKVDDRVPLPKTKDVYKAWAAAEQQRAAAARLPARTLDEDCDDDPYRLVMFSDIEMLLFDVTATPSPLPWLSAVVRGQMIDFFLLFCRLPPAFVASEWVERAMRDPFLSSDGTMDTIAEEQETTSPSVLLRRVGTSIASSLEALFAPPGWFSVFPSKPRCSEATASFATRTVEQLVGAVGQQQQLAHYYLALLRYRTPEALKKVAKSLLRLHPSNIHLYHSYALAESANGNFALADKIFQSAANELRHGEFEILVMGQSWAWVELEAGVRHERATAHLCWSVGELTAPEDEATPYQILSARQKLASARDYKLSMRTPAISATYAQSATLLEYLTVQGGSESSSPRQGNLTAAMASVHAYSDEYRKRQPDGLRGLELFLQFASRLLFFHASHGPYQPAYLRAQFRAFVELFPRNTMFLSLYVWSEAGPRLRDPVRDLVRTAVLAPPHDGVAARASAIDYELRAGNAHSARAAFEDAVASDACRGNAGLWISYLAFCHARPALRPKAKGVFERAVRACPWSKDVLMLAFTLLPHDMATAELRSVYGTMRDEGLRLHLDLDDFADTWRAGERRGELAQKQGKSAEAV